MISNAIREFRIPLAALGIYLSTKGYAAFDGDQAYRLPLLFARQDPTVYRNDPFVRAFDVFNPHAGYLGVLDLLSRGLGLSLALFLAFSATFLLTFGSVGRLAKFAWPNRARSASVLAAIAFFTAKAGNIGTNHLFEAMLLDRLVAFAMFWYALAEVLQRPDRAVVSGALATGFAAWVHPSAGIQAAAWILAVWWLQGFRRAEYGRACLATVAIAVCLVPSLILMASQSDRLLSGMTAERFWDVCARLQSPQHMLPSAWRIPQWTAWAAYFGLAAIGLLSSRSESGLGQIRDLICLVVLMLLALAGSVVLIEQARLLKITVFQPFRSSTLARGLAIVLASGHTAKLWETGGRLGRARVGLLLGGFAGDMCMSTAVAIEAGISIAERLGLGSRTLAAAFCLGSLGGGAYLALHDTQSGHLPLLSGVLAALVFSRLTRFVENPPARVDSPSGSFRGARALFVAVWIVPLTAFLAGIGFLPDGRAPRRLVEHCRFTETPIDDVERIALWCRENAPRDAVFVGPPGPKTFRLWSRRALAFNRAAGPYHAAGLADWVDRFQAHVGFGGDLRDFIAAYLSNRRGVESAYDQLSDERLLDLLRREGASYALVSSKRVSTNSADGPFTPIRVEGAFAILSVNSPDPRAPDSP